MKLTTETVQELVHLRAKIADLQDKEKTLTESCKKLMKSKKLEEFGPSDSPYKFVYNSYERSSVSWHQEWKVIAKKVFGGKWKKEESKLKEDSKTPVTSLNIEPNEKYK